MSPWEWLSPTGFLAVPSQLSAQELSVTSSSMPSPMAMRASGTGSTPLRITSANFNACCRWFLSTRSSVQEFLFYFSHLPILHPPDSGHFLREPSAPFCPTLSQDFVICSRNRQAGLNRSIASTKSATTVAKNLSTPSRDSFFKLGSLASASFSHSDRRNVSTLFIFPNQVTESTSPPAAPSGQESIPSPGTPPPLTDKL